MFNSLSNRIACFFAHNNVIPQEEVDSYSYGFHIIFISTVNWGIIFLIALLTHTLIPSAAYVAVVVTLRHHTGGYHADTHLKCCIISVLMYLLVLFYINRIGNTVGLIITILITLIALIIVLQLSPIIHKNNPIKSDKLKRHKLFSYIIALVATVAIALCLFYKHLSLAYGLSLGMFQVSVFLVIELILQRRRSVSYEI